MVIRDMFTKEFAVKYGDVDIYGDVTDLVIPAFCGPLFLTDAGVENYKNVLNVEIEVRQDGVWGNEVFLECEKYAEQNGLDAEEVEADAYELFCDAAGYCNADDYDAWFVMGWEE